MLSLVNTAKSKCFFAERRSEQGHSCECGKGFGDAVNLKRHKLIHEGEAAKKWKCQYCGKICLFEKYLIPRKRIHAGEKTFVCDAHGRDSNQYAVLYMHKQKFPIGTSGPPPQKVDERTEAT